jgi:hypothetical protein
MKIKTLLLLITLILSKNVGMLYSFKGNRLDTLYRNEGHENWVQGFHPDYKKNILEKIYTVAFTSPDSAGMRTLVERQGP